MGRILKSVAVLMATTMVGVMPAHAGNPVNGARVFSSQCSVCHGSKANSPQMVGPRLFGVVGRRAGTMAGYVYSPAMKASGLAWSEPQLRVYLAGPAKVVKGTKMPYAGLHDPTQLDDLIAFLATLH